MMNNNNTACLPPSAQKAELMNWAVSPVPSGRHLLPLVLWYTFVPIVVRQNMLSINQHGLMRWSHDEEGIPSSPPKLTDWNPTRPYSNRSEPRGLPTCTYMEKYNFGALQNTYNLLNLIVFTFSTLYDNTIFRRIGKTFRVEFQRYLF